MEKKVICGNGNYRFSMLVADRRYLKVSVLFDPNLYTALKQYLKVSVLFDPNLYTALKHSVKDHVVWRPLQFNVGTDTKTSDKVPLRLHLMFDV